MNKDNMVPKGGFTKIRREEKKQGGKKGTAEIQRCCIYPNDIESPLQKEFSLQRRGISEVPIGPGGNNQLTVLWKRIFIKQQYLIKLLIRDPQFYTRMMAMGQSQVPCKNIF